MEQFFIGLLFIFIGLLFTFAGYQLFRILIPIWGFIAGFSWVVDIFSIGNGAGFLTTVFGILIALFAGVVLGALAYFFYEFAVALFAVSVGYWFVAGVLLWLGFPFGFFGVVTAFVAGFALAWASLYYRAPKGILVALSAVGGGAVAITGVMLMFGLVSPAIVGYGLMGYIIKSSFLWTLTWIGLIVIGVLSQMRFSQMINMDTYYPYPSSYTSLTGVKGGTASKEDDTKDQSNLE